MATADHEHDSTRGGFLYVVTGEIYMKEAISSAKTFKKAMPDIPIALFTDAGTPVLDHTPFSIEGLISNPEFNFSDRMRVMKNPPFERTYFVDTDTVCVAPCHELFDLLDRFDITAAHAPMRVGLWHHQEISAPPSFPGLNGGVIGFRNCPAFQALMDDCLELYARFNTFTPPPPHDQPALREAIYRSSARLYVLPPEYNIRTHYAYLIGGNSVAKILHGRGKGLADAIQFAEKDPPGRQYPVAVQGPN